VGISRVKLRLLNERHLLASASVSFDWGWVVHDIKLIEAGGRRFLAMPAKKLANGEYMDLVHPTSPDARRELEGHVFAAYEEALAHRDQSNGEGRW